MLQREVKEIDEKCKQATSMKMDKVIISKLEDVLAVKEMQVELKEAKLDKLNNMLSEAEFE